MIHSRVLCCMWCISIQYDGANNTRVWNISSNANNQAYIRICAHVKHLRFRREASSVNRQRKMKSGGWWKWCMVPQPPEITRKTSRKKGKALNIREPASQTHNNVSLCECCHHIVPFLMETRKLFSSQQPAEIAAATATQTNRPSQPVATTHDEHHTFAPPKNFSFNILIYAIPSQMAYAQSSQHTMLQSISSIHALCMFRWVVVGDGGGAAGERSTPNEEKRLASSAQSHNCR